MTGQEVHDRALHLGDSFRMVDRVGVGILCEAGITQLVVHRDTIAVVVEVVEQLLAAQVVGDNGQAVLVLVDAVIGAQIAASDAHAPHTEGFAGSIVLVGHLHTIAVGGSKQQTVGVVGVVHVLSARLTSDLPYMGQTTSRIILETAGAGLTEARRIDRIDSVAGVVETCVAANAVFHILQNIARSGNRHGVAAGVGQGLEHLDIGVVVVELHRRQIEDPLVVALVGDGGGAAGDGQLHALAGLIRPLAVGVLEVMTGAILIHVHIVGRSGAIVVIRQGFTVQSLLHIHLPASAGAKGGHITVAGVVDVADRHRHAVAAAGSILALKDQVAVVQADMAHTGTANILILIDEIVFQTSQRDVVDGDIGLGVGMIAGIQLQIGTGGGFQRKAVVLAAIPLADQIGDVVVIPGLVSVHVLVVQRLDVAEVRSIVVGDGLTVPILRYFLQVDGSSRGGRGLGLHIEDRLGDVVGRINGRQTRSQELDESTAGAPGGAAVGNSHAGVRVALNRIGIGAGHEVIFDGAGVVLGDDSRIQNDGELSGLHPVHVGGEGDAPGEGITSRLHANSHGAIGSLHGSILQVRLGQRERHFAGGRNDLDGAILHLLGHHVRHGDQEGHRLGVGQILEGKEVLEAQGLDRAVHVNAGDDVLINDFTFQVVKDSTAAVILRMTRLDSIDDPGLNILSVFQLPGKHAAIFSLHEDHGCSLSVVELHLQFIVAAVGQVGVASSISDRDQRVVDLLQFARSLVLKMNRFGVHDSLIQTATEGKDLTGSGAATTILSTRHPVHFLQLDGAGKLAQPFFDSILALLEFVTHVGFLLSDWFRFC